MRSISIVEILENEQILKENSIEELNNLESERKLYQQNKQQENLDLLESSKKQDFKQIISFLAEIPELE